MSDYTIYTRIGDANIELRIEFEYFPGTPAKITGTMEDGCPAEGPTLNVTEVQIVPSIEPRDITDFEIWGQLIDKACLNHVASIGEA